MSEKSSDRKSPGSRSDWEFVRKMRDEDNPPDPDAPFLTDEELANAEWFEANSEEEVMKHVRERNAAAK